VPGTWKDYPTFLELFTRPLPPGARPLPSAGPWLSPADGTLADLVPVTPEGTWLIKGTPYGARELLGEQEDRYRGFQALQIHLAPRDYHRFHAPCGMVVTEAWSQEGDLQPVDPSLARPSLRLLVRNRRILLHCRSEEGTPFALLLVGAFNVGRILLRFDATLGGKRMQEGLRHYDPPRSLAAGEEMGRFELGSTLVLFAPPDRRPLLAPGAPCRARVPILAAPTGEAEN